MNFDNLGWLILKTSGQASVLIVFVLTIQWALSSRIPASWRYALWAPVLLRLLLPVAPESRFSLFNLFAPSPGPVVHENIAFRTIQTDGPSPVIPSADTPALPPQSMRRRLSAMEITAGVWLIVAVSLMARAIVSHIQLVKMLRRSGDCRDERIRRSLEESRRALGVWKELSVIEHPMIGSPALFGFIKPRLLLPIELNSRFSDVELRHIFLHELAHLKRRDLWTNWLLIIAQALHWFNPLVWFAARRIRADREFACDAMALEYTNESTPIQFGETMVKVLKLFCGSSRGLETISVVRDAAELKRRIQRIATWNPGRSRPLIWSALLGVVCLAGLSDAQTETRHSNTKDPHVSKQILPSNVDFTGVQPSSSPGNTAELDFYAKPVRAKHAGDLKGEIGGPSEESENDIKVSAATDPTSLSKSASVVTPSAVEAPKPTVIQREGSGAKLIRRRLETIRFDEFGVPAETPLSEVIERLGQAVKDHDPERRGVNFIITSSQDANAKNPNDPASTDQYRVKVDPPLRDAQLKGVLAAITNGARAPGRKGESWRLNYSIEDYGVVFLASPAPRDDSTLYSRTFKLDPDTFLKAVRNRLRPADSIRPDSVQLEIREFFESVGIQFSKTADGNADQKRKSMFFNEKTGVLLVRATLDELDLIENVIHQTQPKAWAFQVKLIMRVTETAAGSKQSGAELMDASAVAASMKPLLWKTNATENSAPIISTVIDGRDWKALSKSFERQPGLDLMTTHETTIPSGTEIAVSIGGEVHKDNNADVRLISTVLGDDIILTTGFSWTDAGHVDTQGNTFSVNAFGYVTRKVFAATRLAKGQTVILSVPRVFQDGKDLLLFITPQNLGASPK